MTKIRVYSATSIDGFIADSDGDTQWMAPYWPSIYEKSGFLDEVGAVVLGRRTFQLVTTFGEWPYVGKRAFVLTSEPLKDSFPDVAYARNGIAAAIQAAREATTKDIWIVGGAMTMQSAIDAGLVDMIEICIVPVFFGSGISLLTSLEETMRLHFDGIEAFPDGIVKLRYHVPKS